MPCAIRVELKVAYHDACHLAHAQGVREPPRELLRAIPGLELVEPAEWELCCGSAGHLQPHPARRRRHSSGARKAANLEATGAQAIAAGNPGCALQIAAHLERPRAAVSPDVAARRVDPRGGAVGLERQPRW